MRHIKLSPKQQHLALVGFGVCILFLAVLGIAQTFGISLQSFLPQNNKKAPQGKLYQATIKELLARGGNYMCAWDEQQKNIQSTGVAYVAGGNIAADATVTVSGFTVDANAIGDGKTFYVWTSLPGSKGVKVSYSELDKTGKSSAQAALLKQKLNFTCQAWNPDKTRFVVPQEVMFE